MLHAYQVDPEYQEPPFEYEYYQDVIFLGNRNYISHVPDELKPVFNRFEEKKLLRALRLVTGKRYERKTIQGCCQGDWQDIYYPISDYSEAAIDFLEIEYFNLGAEWIIDNDYSIYTHGWNNNLIRAEIAKYAGVPPENVKLHVFTGYTKTPKYMEV